MAIPPKKPSTQIVTKNVSAIHISADLTMIQRKLVNALLYHAYDELLVEDTHTISIPLLMEMIGFGSRNQDHLKKAIRGLTEKSVEWDMMEDDGTNVWEVSTLLSYARIRKGLCTFRYDKSLAEKLKNPDVFAKINLSVIRYMRSAHSLALYENCYRYIGVGQTPRWDIGVFRKLMGVDHLGSYQEFKIFKRDVILPAIKEVNKVSNIQIELETVINGRSVVAVQFLVRFNPQLSLLGMEQEDYVTSSRAYKLLLKEGIGKRLAYAWVAQNGEEYVLEKIELVADRDAKGKIKSSRSGYLKSAIDSDYNSEVSQKKKRLDAAEEARKQRRMIEARLDQAKQHLRELERAYRDTCVKLVLDAVEKLSEEDRIEVERGFKASLGSKIFADSFKSNGWGARLVFADVCCYWSNRGVSFPDVDDVRHSESNSKVSELRDQIKHLESQLI